MDTLEGKKTFTGIAAMLLAWLGTTLGVDLGDGTEIITAMLTLVGAALAIYGRIVAKPKPEGGTQ
jgi:hypothetical protein